jgi:pyrimidine operon attenuation protein/uracil phosphoribosyltransferase
MKKTEILNSKQIQQKLNRLTYEVLENNFEEKELLIAGIDGNGYLLAQHVVKALKKITKQKITLGKISLDKKNPLATQVHGPPRTRRASQLHRLRPKH